MKTSHSIITSSLEHAIMSGLIKEYSLTQSRASDHIENDINSYGLPIVRVYIDKLLWFEIFGGPTVSFNELWDEVLESFIAHSFRVAFNSINKIKNKHASL